jgi:hypothetical protein
MKKSPFLAALLLIGGSLSGCPVYEANDVGCLDDLDCPDGSVCDGPSGVCVVPGDPADTAVSCRRPLDCDPNETCGRFGTCSVADCHFSSVGCVHGYVCSPDSGRWQCEEAATDADAGGAGAGGTASTTDGAGAGGVPNASGAAGAAMAGAGG